MDQAETQILVAVALEILHQFLHLKEMMVAITMVQGTAAEEAAVVQEVLA